MTIAEVREKCKSIPRDATILGILVIASILSFWLGFMAGLEEKARVGESAPKAPETAPNEAIVASKNGTKYYPPGCAGADRISPANRVIFPTPEAAEAAGYTRAGNCAAN